MISFSPVFAKNEPASDSVEINLDALEEIDGGETIDEYTPPPMFGGATRKKVASPVWVDEAEQRDYDTPPAPGKKPAAKYATPDARNIPTYSEYTHIIDGTPNLGGQAVFRQMPTKKASLPSSQTKSKPKAKKSPIFVDDAASQRADFEIEQLEQPTAEQILAKIDVKDVEADTLYDVETDNISLPYQKGAIVLDAAMKAELDKKIIPKAIGNKRPVLIESYASGSDEGESASRRLSLARALDIRDYLVSHKVSGDKVDIRPLGTKIPENRSKTPPDRVDIYLLEKANH